MEFKKKYDYILQNEVDITIYDRLRELIKEFGEEDLFHGSIENRCNEEKKYHISNVYSIDDELEAMLYISDEISDLLSSIRKREEKLRKIKEFEKWHVIIDGVIYKKTPTQDDEYINLSTEDYRHGVSAKPDNQNIETREVYYKVDLKTKKEGRFSSDSICIGNSFTRSDVEKIIQNYVIDRKITIDKDYYDSEEGKRDLSINLLVELLDG